ncbi:hypothetical protein BKA66DRAFT_554703 [Pyrenochaeta sp. MPI-SDFR-AT-0127]|nr:hypothetical protein BKA66DRAFT_554703 [Pyrenochaeta sp. MPI-SDFR-AT-0127]
MVNECFATCAMPCALGDVAALAWTVEHKSIVSRVKPLINAHTTYKGAEQQQRWLVIETSTGYRYGHGNADPLSVSCLSSLYTSTYDGLVHAALPEWHPVYSPDSDILGPVGQARESACILAMRQTHWETYSVARVADVADQNVVLRSRGCDDVPQSDGLLQRARTGKSWCYMNHKPCSLRMQVLQYGSEKSRAHVDSWRMSCHVWGNIVPGLSNDLVMLCHVSQEWLARQQETTSVRLCSRRMPCKTCVTENLGASGRRSVRRSSRKWRSWYW